MRKKIISEKAILKKAIEILKEHGLEACTMRTVAAKSGIAVGTLYNYYSSQEELLAALFKQSWKNTLEKIKPVSAENLSTEEKLYKFYRILKKEINARKGLGRKIFINNGPVADLTGVHTRIQQDFSEVLKKIICESERNSKLKEDLQNLTAQWLMLIMLNSIVTYPNNTKEQDAMHLAEMVSRFL